EVTKQLKSWLGAGVLAAASTRCLRHRLDQATQALAALDPAAGAGGGRIQEGAAQRPLQRPKRWPLGTARTRGRRRSAASCRRYARHSTAVCSSSRNNLSCEL